MVLGINKFKMKSVGLKDKKKRNLNYKSESSLLLLKHLSKNKMLNTSIRLNAVLILFNYSLNNFKSRLVNRCIITNRKSKIRNNLKFSRLSFFKIARAGLIPGLKKSSW